MNDIHDLQDGLNNSRQAFAREVILPAARQFLEGLCEQLGQPCPEADLTVEWEGPGGES